MGHEILNQVIRVSSEYYHTVLDMLPVHKRAFVDPHVTADTYYLVFIHGEPKAGFGVNHSGYLCGLFSLIPRIGRELFALRLTYAKAYAHPDAEYFKIFCIGEHLCELYESFGFEVTKTYDWDDSLAPDNWDYARYGRPKVYDLQRKI